VDLGFVQVEPLTYIRGRSLPNVYMIVDEAQNLTPHEVKTIISRGGENTKMVFTGDIAPLYHMDLSGATIGLLKSGNCAVRRDKERELLAKFGKQGDDPYFGATIALIDAARYRDANKLQACIDVAKTYPGFLVLYDQSILNCAFALDEIASVPLTWIQEAPRSGRLPDFRPGMIHICGSPKPWDLLGEWFHPYYKEWRAVATRGGLPGVNWKNYFSAQALRRAWRVRRQYAVWLKP